MTAPAKFTVTLLVLLALAVSTIWWWQPVRCALFKERCFIETCIAEARYPEAACEATPSTTPASRTGREGHCKLRLKAESGYFFADKHITMIEETHAGIPVTSAATIESVSGSHDRDTGINYLNALNSRTACMTAPDAETECRASARITAPAYPTKCLPVRIKLTGREDAG